LAEKVGITSYQIDPLVRSSYKAALSWQEAKGID
jgi:lipoate synthase